MLGWGTRDKTSVKTTFGNHSEIYSEISLITLITLISKLSSLIQCFPSEPTLFPEKTVRLRNSVDTLFPCRQTKLDIVL